MNCNHRALGSSPTVKDGQALNGCGGDALLEQTVPNDNKVRAKISDKQIVKVIVAPQRLVNVVVK